MRGVQRSARRRRRAACTVSSSAAIEQLTTSWWPARPRRREPLTARPGPREAGRGRVLRERVGVAPAGGRSGGHLRMGLDGQPVLAGQLAGGIPRPSRDVQPARAEPAERGGGCRRATARRWPPTASSARAPSGARARRPARRRAPPRSRPRAARSSARRARSPSCGRPSRASRPARSRPAPRAAGCRRSVAAGAGLVSFVRGSGVR